MPFDIQTTYKYALRHPVYTDSTFVLTFYTEQDYLIWKDFLAFIDEKAKEYAPKQSK